MKIDYSGGPIIIRQEETKELWQVSQENVDKLIKKVAELAKRYKTKDLYEILCKMEELVVVAKTCDKCSYRGPLFCKKCGKLLILWCARYRDNKDDRIEYTYYCERCKEKKKYSLVSAE